MNEEIETLHVELPLDAIDALLDEKMAALQAHIDGHIAALQAHIDGHIARLEGMLIMATATRPAAAPARTAPAQPVAPTTQVPVNTLPAQVPLYSIQNGAYAGWWCYYTADRRSHPVLSREQAPAWDNLFGTRNNNPTLTRAEVIQWETYNAAQIEEMRTAAREWAQSQTPVVQAPTLAPAAPPVPEFNDKIPDFA